jgi:FkbM family methyltransferase
MRVRLSQSKVGPLVCPRRITIDADLHSLGRGVRLRSHTSDISVLGEVLLAGSYIPAAAALDDATATIVDLGANTGLVARWLLERFPNARIVSVEPEPGNLAVLRHNLTPYDSRAVVVGACVGARERRVALETTHGEFAFEMKEVTGAAEAGDADVVTMSTVLDALGSRCVDFLKCDIEGAERELFSSCGEWAPLVRVMSVECHGAFTARDLINALHAHAVKHQILHVEPTPQFGCEGVILRVAV